MKKNTILHAFTVFVMLSLACNFFTGIKPGGNDVENTKPTITVEPTAEPLIPTGNGPQGLTAEATSADSVLLVWQPVEGATSYHLVVSTNNDEVLTVVDLDPSITQYEDFLAAPGSQLTYAVEALGESGSIGQSIVNVATPARQPNPIQLMVEFDESESVTQVVGASGGIVSVEDQNGVSYELSIPPNALDEDIEITLTPLADLSNWPLDGDMVGAVGIEPEGLILNVPAYLTITPPSELEDNDLATVGFTFEGYGDEFALLPLTNPDILTASMPGNVPHYASLAQQSKKKNVIRLPVVDLTPKGAGQVSPQRAGEIARENPPSDSSAAFDQKDAASLANEDDLVPLPNLKWLERYNTFHRRIQDVTECHELTDAIIFLQEASKLKNDSKDQATRIDHEDQAMDEVVEKAKEVIDNAGEECKEKKSDGQKFTNGPCALQLMRKISAGATPFYKELQTHMLKVYGQDVLVTGQFNITNTCKSGYVMNGGAGGMEVVSGTICDITQPFSVHATVYGGGMTLTFTPSPANEGESPGGGTFMWTGAAGGFSLKGSGSFTMFGSPGSTMYIKTEASGTVDEHGGSGSESYTLTKEAYACGK